MLPWRHALLALAVVAVWGSNFTVAKLGLRALAAGSLANLMSAALAGLLIG